MDEFETFESVDSNGQDISLVADQNFFVSRTNLLEDQLFDKLSGSKQSLRPIDHLEEPFKYVAKDPPSLISSSHGYSSHSYTTFNNINISNDRSGFAPLPNSIVSHPLTQSSEDVVGLDLGFEPTLSLTPHMPVPTTSPATPLDKNISQAHLMPRAEGIFIWPPMNTKNPTQISGADYQQQFPMVASLPDQLSQSQTNITQTQYLQAMRQLQFAENQFAISMQPPFQSPMNAQSTQNFQQLHVSPHSQNLPTKQNSLSNTKVVSVKPLQPVCHDSTRHTSTSASPSVSTKSSSIVASVAVSSLKKQPVEPEKLSRPQKVCINHTARTVRTVQSVQNKRQDHAQPTPYGQLTFINLHDAEAAMPMRYIEQDWQGPSSDETIPYTDADRAHWVAKMLNAMEDTSKCKDNKAGFSFLKRWEKHDYYNTQEMEKVCWRMLDVAERLHAYGPSATNIYCQDALKKLYASRGLTFEERIVAICDMLALSKFLCDNLMKGEGIEALVGAPKQKMSGAKTMMVQNKKRQNWLETGRRTDAGRAYNEEDDEQDITLNTFKVQEPSQRRPRQKHKRSDPAKEHRAPTEKCLRGISLDSDSFEEDLEFPSHRPTFDNNFEDQIDDDDINEFDRIISPTSSLSLRTPSDTPIQIFMGTSPASPTSTASLTPASALKIPPPFTSTMLSVSAHPSLSPSPPKHYPATHGRGNPHVVTSASFQATKRRLAIQRETVKQRTGKRAAISCLGTATKVVTRNPLGELTIDLTGSVSEPEDSSLPCKRQRRSSFSVNARKVSRIPSYHSDSDGFTFLQPEAELTTDNEQDTVVRHSLVEDSKRALALDEEPEATTLNHGCLDQPRVAIVNSSYLNEPEVLKSDNGNELHGFVSEKRIGTSYSSLRRKRATPYKNRDVDRRLETFES